MYVRSSFHEEIDVGTRFVGASKCEQSRPSTCFNVSGNWAPGVSQVVCHEIEPRFPLTGFTSREYVHLHEIEPRFPLSGVTSREYVHFSLFPGVHLR